MHRQRKSTAYRVPGKRKTSGNSSTSICIATIFFRLITLSQHLFFYKCSNKSSGDFVSAKVATCVGTDRRLKPCRLDSILQPRGWWDTRPLALKA